LRATTQVPANLVDNRAINDDMDAMGMTTATFDLDLYPSVAVIKAAHRFSGTHAIRVDRLGRMAKVTLTPRSENSPNVSADLSDAVVDEALREVVHERTATLHDTLVKAAFQPVRSLP
jgi:His-Xaa-Ser system protein HxsD